MKIPTKDASGNPNGHVIPVWSVNERPELLPDQVYVTTVFPHSHKGPHLHMVRRGLFCCIKGNVRVVTRKALNIKGTVAQYSTHYSGDDHNHALIEVPTGVAACLYNDGDEEAIVINMPNPAWSKDQPDEHEVENWNPINE